MNIQQKLWEVTEKLNDYHVGNAEKMRRMIDEGPEGSLEFEEFADSDASFMEEIGRELEAIVNTAVDEERVRVRKALENSVN